MTLSYFLRLLCLCLATFFIANAALGLAVRFFESSIIRFSDKLRPRAAARFLLAVRALPAALAALIVLGLCLPSYLWLEPNATNERVGVVFVSFSFLGVLICAIAAGRAIRAVSSTSNFIRICEKSGRRVNLPGESLPALVLEGESTILATVGILNPQLVISRKLLNVLSTEQVAAAARHEQAHRSSRENLKRLFLLLLPDIIPFSRVHSALDHAWAKFSEWAADDSAVGGDSGNSVSLAEALVGVARAGAPARLAPLCTSLVPTDQVLAARVDRLLRAPVTQEQPVPRRRIRALAIPMILVTSAVLVVLLIQPATLHSVHQLLEKLTH
jgi:Zn-dependent protease with chaperone function